MMLRFASKNGILTRKKNEAHGRHGGSRNAASRPTLSFGAATGDRPAKRHYPAMTHGHAGTAVRLDQFNIYK
jgi:hypothetical protein